MFNPCTQKQRAALLLSNGVLYIGLGGDGNRGALFAFDAATLTQKAFWSTTPTGINGGIWQSGQGPAADADGNVYLMTGNGKFDADTNGQNYGDSFVKLHLDGSNIVVKRLLSRRATRTTSTTSILILAPRVRRSSPARRR